MDHEFFLLSAGTFSCTCCSLPSLVLLVDGHSTHCDLLSVKFARDNGIIIFCLSPHTTHKCQPLDCTGVRSLFKPLKEYWKQEYHKFYCKNTRKVSKISFNGIFQNAWLNAITLVNVAAGFRKAGVYPFNQNAISCPKFLIVKRMKSHK